MGKLLNNFKRTFSQEKIAHPGIYQYLSPGEDPRNYRLHLRVEADGNGILIINASTILHLAQENRAAVCSSSPISSSSSVIFIATKSVSGSSGL